VLDPCRMASSKRNNIRLLKNVRDAMAKLAPNKQR
jgi:hypothetical protein